MLIFYYMLLSFLLFFNLPPDHILISDQFLTFSAIFFFLLIQYSIIVSTVIIKQLPQLSLDITIEGMRGKIGQSFS